MLTRRDLGKLLSSVALLPSAAKAALNGTMSSSSGRDRMSATLTLVNNGSSTTPGTPTQSFMWIFRKGDIPQGQAPVFTASGAVQPFSASPANMRRYWPDGSLQSCVFALRPTFSISAGASEAVAITTGGNWPSASARATAEVYSQGLNIQCPVAPITRNGFDSVSETWGAWLINDSNLINSGAMAPLVDLDGDAGKRWRFTVNMAKTQGGTAHGQLITTFYIWALNDSGGNLGGFRWSGYLRQPFYDVDTPPKGIRVFAPPNSASPSWGPNWSANGLSATAMSFLGNNGDPLSRQAFQVNRGQAETASKNNYGLSNTNVFPCFFTTTDTLPAPLDPNTLYYSQSATGTDVNIFVNAGGFNHSQSGGTVALTNSGSGDHMIVPCLASVPFNKSVSWKGSNGKYLFFQGTGSILTETTLRSQVDRAYWQSTKLIPPFDLSLSSTTNGGSITDTAYNSPWSPISICTITWDQVGAGDHTDIGILPNEAVLDFYNQSVSSELSIRCFATAAALTQFDFYYSKTGSLVNLSARNYTGLPDTSLNQATMLQWGEARAAGFTEPPSNVYAAGFASNQREHRPQYSLWAWLRTGELDFLELLLEQGNSGILCNLISRRNMRKPNTITGSCVGFDVEYRSLAWAERDVQWCALFAPYDPINPSSKMADGTQIAKYFIDLADADGQRVQDCLDPINGYFDNPTVSGSTAYMCGRKLWTCRNEEINYSWLTNNPEWEFAFLAYDFCIAFARGDLNSAKNLADTATRWNYVKDTFSGTNGGFWNITGYYTYWGAADIGGPDAHQGSYCTNSDALWGTFASWDSIAWSATASPGPSQRAFKFVNLHNSLTPGDGDLGYFPGTGAKGLASYNNQWLYIVDWDRRTGTFNVSASKSGPPIAIVDSNSYSQPIPYQSNNAPPTDWCSREAQQPLGLYNILQIRSACCWGNALGIDFGRLLSDIAYRLAKTSGGPYSTVIYPTVVNGRKISDARYAYQTTYHA